MLLALILFCIKKSIVLIVVVLLDGAIDCPGNLCLRWLEAKASSLVLIPGI